MLCSRVFVEARLLLCGLPALRLATSERRQNAAGTQFVCCRECDKEVGRCSMLTRDETKPDLPRADFL